jgi:hypothetical protein
MEYTFRHCTLTATLTVHARDMESARASLWSLTQYPSEWEWAYTHVSK